MTKGDLALQMPSSYVLMDEDEMMYVGGGSIVCTLNVGRAKCKSVYKEMSKFNGWSQLVVSTIAGIINVGAGVLSGIVFLWYSSVQHQFEMGGYYSGYKGAKVLFYDTGSTPSVIAVK